MIPGHSKYGIFNEQGEQVYHAFEGTIFKKSIFVIKKVLFRTRFLSAYMLSTNSRISTLYR